MGTSAESEQTIGLVVIISRNRLLASVPLQSQLPGTWLVSTQRAHPAPAASKAPVPWQTPRPPVRHRPVKPSNEHMNQF
jgi:hypothetical protein